MPSWLHHKLRIPSLIRETLQYDGLILHDLHHRSHAASAFFPSPFESAAILTVDGVGEWATAAIGVGKGNVVELRKEMRFPHSLGLLYSAFTQFTGFRVNSGEYKMMGLAPYGKPVYVDRILDNLVDVKADGSIEFNMDYFGFLTQPSMVNTKFEGLFGGPARHPEARIGRRELDIARSIQVVTEEILLRMARYAKEITSERFLCLAGGVALNCVANGRLLREGPFEDLWIQPAAGDAGCALGAALDAYHSHFGRDRLLGERGGSSGGGSLLGPEFGTAEIDAFLETYGYPYRKLLDEERPGEIAKIIASGRVVGHFSGRMEFGPRALGARSILADPRNPETQVNLNVKIKYRESFRPFAPAVLAEKVSEYFEFEGESPYMLLVAPVRADRRKPFDQGDGTDLLRIVRKARSDIPAVTHIDYSARLQTVNRDHPEYRALIESFEDTTGYGVLVNTSFNVRGEPIVCSPYDAYRCFMRTEMDALALGNHLLLKEDQPPWPEERGHVEMDAVQPPAALDATVTRRLDRIFRRFLVAGRDVKARGDCLLDLGVRGGDTSWIDHEPDRASFVIPEELDRWDSGPAAYARGVVKNWTSAAASDSLLPVLVMLIRLGQRYPENDAEYGPMDDSIYVMY